MLIRRREEQAGLPVENAEKTEITWLVDRHDGASNFEMRKFRIKPGGSIPKHLHPEIEHEQYILKGRMIIGIGDKSYEVKEGDAVFIPANTPHWYKNEGEEDVEFICVIPKREKYETIYLED